MIVTYWLKFAIFAMFISAFSFQQLARFETSLLGVVVMSWN